MTPYQRERIAELIPCFVDAIKHTLKCPGGFDLDLVDGLSDICALIEEPKDEAETIKNAILPVKEMLGGLFENLFKLDEARPAYEPTPYAAMFSGEKTAQIKDDNMCIEPGKSVLQDEPFDTGLHAANDGVANG